jgi:hypothetical protein
MEQSYFRPTYAAVIDKFRCKVDDMGSTLIPVAPLVRSGRPGSRTMTFVVRKFYLRHHPKFFTDSSTLKLKDGKDIKTERKQT